MKKNYNEIFNSFYGNYTQRYCEEHNLFVKYGKDNEAVELTRQFVDYANEVVNTDLSLIFGKQFGIESPDKKTNKALQKLLKENDFMKLAKKVVMQGLVMGDTFIKVGRDAGGQVKIGYVDVMNSNPTYLTNSGEVVGWTFESDYFEDGIATHIVEYFGMDFVIISVNDKIVKKIPNRYGELWVKHIANIPSLADPVWGETELTRIIPVVDEMNSTLSRIGSIEDIYANPRIILSGVRSPENLKQEHNVWSIAENSTVKILEYQGNVIPAMLDKYNKLEAFIKNKCPELILNDLGNISGYSLKLKLSKLIRKIENYRNTYFEGFKGALKLALKMEGFDNPDVIINSAPVIPADEVEDVKKWASLLSMGIVSKETVANHFGFDYTSEQKRINADNWLGE